PHFTIPRTGSTRPNEALKQAAKVVGAVRGGDQDAQRVLELLHFVGPIIVCIAELDVRLHSGNYVHLGPFSVRCIAYELGILKSSRGVTAARIPATFPATRLKYRASKRLT